MHIHPSSRIGANVVIHLWKRSIRAFMQIRALECVSRVTNEALRHQMACQRVHRATNPRQSHALFAQRISALTSC